MKNTKNITIKIPPIEFLLLQKVEGTNGEISNDINKARTKAATKHDQIVLL